MTVAPSHVIRHLAFKKVPPSLAHTLAECLFWYQKATVEMDGEPAVWKTGPELSEALGIKPRTANEHMKRLARAGYWRLVRKARPNHQNPSPVTWIILQQAGRDLLREAQASASAAQTSKGRRSRPSSGQITDVQMSAEPTDLSLPALSSPATDFSFQSGPKAKPNSKSFGSSQKKKYGEDAPEEIKAFVKIFQDRFIAKGQNLWDTSSQFTWAHSETLYRSLEAKGVTADEMPSLVADLLNWWSAILDKLPHTYRCHPSNVGRPSPKALGDQADLVAQLIIAMRLSASTPKPKLAGKYKW